MPDPANDTTRSDLLAAERRRQIEQLAREYPSDTLRAAADRAFERELEQSVESAQPPKFPF